jgi:hypothetical protein
MRPLSCRLAAAQGAQQELMMLQQAADAAELQQGAVLASHELDAHQLLALLQQQQLAAQQEQVRGWSTSAGCSATC